MREVGRMPYKEREREQNSFSVHKHVRGNETVRVRGRWKKGNRDGGREAEIVSL